MFNVVRYVKARETYDPKALKEISTSRSFCRPARRRVI